MTRLRWFRIGLGLAIGLIFGLYYAWDVSPRRISRASPRDMDGEFQNEYRVLVAEAYAHNANLLQARRRLDLLSDENPQGMLNRLAQQSLAAGQPQVEVRAVALLADEIGAFPSSTDTPSPTSTEESELFVTGSPPPSATPTNTPTLTYRIERIEKVCDPTLPGPLIQIITLDQDGIQIPGVEIYVQWEGGEDRFVTGMKPEIGIGYADFEMNAEIAYSVLIVGGLDPVTNLRSDPCQSGAGGSYPGSILLTFRAP